MTKNPILTNTYIPRKTKQGKYEWYEYDLMSYFNDLKYEELASDTDGYFQNAPVINFNIINHECCDTPLQNPGQYYKIMQKKDFNNYEHHVQTKAISSAIKSKRNDLYFEQDVLKQHFKKKTDTEKD